MYVLIHMYVYVFTSVPMYVSIDVYVDVVCLCGALYVFIYCIKDKSSACLDVVDVPLRICVCFYACMYVYVCVCM